MGSQTAFRLDGKIALVTGGAMGIGLGIAEAFVDAGANVLLLAPPMRRGAKPTAQRTCA